MLKLHSPFPPPKAVIVRDDMLARWGVGKCAVMVSSVFMGLYKRCYKSRELRGALLSWVGFTKGLPGLQRPVSLVDLACRRGIPPLGHGACCVLSSSFSCQPPCASCPVPPHAVRPRVRQEAQKGVKVVLRCPDEAALARIMDAARPAGIPAHSLLEVVAPSSAGESPSRTRVILALGPAPQAALFAAGCQGLPAL